MKHKFFTLLFAILASLGTMFAQSGTCGDNLTWNLTDSVLTISGTGAMADYEWNGAPWYSNKESIKSVIIENSVTSIGNYAFEGCSGLTSIDIPNSVTRIGETPFIFCYNLTSINVAANNAYYCSIDGILFNKDKTTLIQCPNGKAGAYIVPDGVINIGEMAFYECRSLTSVIISNSVTLIKGMAFYECSFLTSVTISNSVTKIESDAFYHCTRLTSVEIPNSVTSIGNYAFSSCSSLASLTIPNSVISIGKGAFKYCAGLTSITNYATTPQLIGAEVFAGTAELGFVDKSTCTLYVPAQSIAAYQAADVWKDFKNILPIEGSEEVNYATLADIYNMAADSTFTLGAFDVMYVPDFQNGSNMYIKDSTGSCVIYKVNYGLQAGDHVEAGLQGKVSIYVGLHEIIPITAKEALTITSGEVPAPVEATEVPSSSNLSQYVVYKGVSFATDTAFVEGRRHAVLGSWNGQTITFYNQYYIGATLSANKTYNITAVNTIYRTTPQAYPLAVEEVSPAPCIIASGTCGAQGDNLTWTLSCDSVLTISGTGAMADYWDDAPWYSNINTIRSVIIEDSVTSIGNNAFYLCTGLTSVTIPNSVTSIGGSAFYGCTGLTSMEIPNSVTNIGAYAFYGCTGLTSVTIPNSVTSIGWSAFSNCSSLTSITIPNSVTSIGEYAFRVCSGLTSITNQATTPQAINTNVFTNVNKSTCTLYVPAESVEAYKAADVWKEFGNILPINSKPAAEHTYTVVGSSEVLFGSLWLETDVNNDMILQKGDDTFLWKKENVTLAAGNIEFKVCEDHSWTQSWPEYNYVLAIAESGVYTIQIYFNPATGIVTADATKQDSCVIASGTCGAQGDNLTWTLSCDSVLTISGTGEMADYSSGKSPWYSNIISIKSVVFEDGVTSIGDKAFYNCSSLTSIDIPNSVTSIEEWAFYRCISLTSVEIPNSVTSIESGAFYNCSSLTSVHISNLVAWCAISFSNTYSNPLFYAHNLYLNGTLVTDLVIPDGVTSIGEYAFYFCSSLTSVTIPNSVTHIGSSAFRVCTGLTSVTIPNSVTSIGEWVFSGCSSLTSINVSNGNANYCSVEGVLFNKDNTVLVQYPGGKRGAYTIPSSVTSIGDNAFLECQELTSIEIPHSVTNIGYAAFCWCTQLSTITIPSSVTSIENEAFQTCRNLTSITNYATTPQTINANVFNNVNKSSCTLYVPAESVDAYKAADVWNEFGNILAIDSTEESDYISVAQALEIGATLDANASTDTTYTIRGYVSSITTPFSEQYLNQTFYIADDSLSTASSNAEGGFFVYRGKPTTGTAIREGTLVELTTAILNYNGRIIENAEQNVPVTVLQEGPECRVFSGICGAQGDNLTWTLSCDSVLTISGTGAMADYEWNGAPWYSNNEAIRSVIIENSVTSIGDYAFYDCTGLTSIDIPNSVTSIGEWAFYSCSSLTSVEIPNSVTSIGEWAFYLCSGLTSVTIPNSVTSIGDNAFDHCSGLTSVTIPNSVTSIGEWAFSYCNSLTSINVSNGNANYCSVEGVLFNKDNTVLVQYPGGKNGNYTIPNGVTSIGEGAFHRCTGLTSVTIPNSVTNIGVQTFYCSGLISVSIPASVTSIGYSAFSGCAGLSAVSVEKGNLVYDSRNNCNAIIETLTNTLIVGCKNTIIPNSVTSIGENAFYRCSGLTSVTIPESVTSIRWGAFSYCDSLTSVTIPNSVTSIGNYAFIYCNSLTSVTNRASNPQSIISNVFEEVNKSTCTLYVPAESVDAYKAADVWKEFGTILPIEDDPVVPSDAVLANYYKQGDVCICFYVPADMGCNDIVLTGSFNGWSSTPAECVKVEPVVGYDGWYVGSFEPEAEPDAVKGIQVKPVMLDVNGNFNWDYQAGAATVIRGSVEVVQGAYAGEVDMFNFGSDVPNVLTIDAWKNNPCTLIYHNYTVTVIIDGYDGCNGLTIPFIVGNMTNWKFEQMQLDMEKTQEYQTAVYYYTFKAEEGTPYQIASGLMDPQTGLVDSTAMPNWYDEAFMQKLVNGVWGRVPGDDGDNQLTHEDAEIVWDLRAEDLRWARCAPEEPTEYTVLAVNLPAVNAPEAVEIIGGFDEWQGTAMELLNTGWFFVELEAKASQFFKFRGAGSWEQVLEYYDAENNTWRELSEKDLIFGQLWQDDTYKGKPCKSIEIDCSYNTNYRWTPAASYTGYAIIDGIRYYLDGQTLSATVNRDYDNYGYIINYSGDVVIPDSVTYLGYRYNVTSIGNSAFMNCGDLTSVTIPNNVTYIGYDAFYNCNNLKSITVLGETPATIDYSAFGNTWSMQTIIYVPCGTIDEYKNAWSDYADHIQYLPKTYDYAIYTLVNDGEMGYVTLPASICEEDRMTAMPYDGYHFVRWSDGETMNPRPFVLTSDTTFTAEFAMTLSGNCGKDYALTWVFNPETKTLTISGRGELTENYTFRTAALKAENIVLNNGMTAIGASAFEGCNLLNEIVVPASVTAIWEYAFSKCTNLESITIPNGEAELLYGVVSGCQNLKYIEAPASILRGLYSSDKLKTVKLNGGEASENISSLSGSYNTLQTLNLGKATLEYMPYTSFFSNFRVLKNIVLPENLTKIDYALLADCYYIESIIIPAEVTEIADRAFEDCRSLASVEFAGDKVQRIGDWAFYNCHELIKIDIPEGVTEIGKAAFYGCSYAQVAHLPASVQVIGDNAFAHCSKIAKMEVYAIVPPAVEDKTFYEVSTTAPVYVPENRVQDYKDHPVWGKLNIVGNAPLGVDNVQNGDSKPTKVLVNGQILILRGEKVYTVTGEEVR